MILVSEPKSIAVSYFSAFLIAGGAFVPPVIFHSWHNSNAFDENGRAFRTGALTFMANVSGELFFSTNLFTFDVAQKVLTALCPFSPSIGIGQSLAFYCLPLTGALADKKLGFAENSVCAGVPQTMGSRLYVPPFPPPPFPSPSFRAVLV